MKVYRSGDLYLVAKGETGRLVPPDGPAYGASNLQSIVAHCNVQEPWQDVPAGDTLPENVQEAIDDDAGWERPRHGQA
jgi:hypothetical protein